MDIDIVLSWFSIGMAIWITVHLTSRIWLSFKSVFN